MKSTEVRIISHSRIIALSGIYSYSTLVIVTSEVGNLLHNDPQYCLYCRVDHRRMYIHKVIIIIGNNVSSRAVPINSSNASTRLQLGVE